MTSELSDDKEESSHEKSGVLRNTSVFIHYVMCNFCSRAVIFCVVQNKENIKFSLYFASLKYFVFDTTCVSICYFVSFLVHWPFKQIYMCLTSVTRVNSD